MGVERIDYPFAVLGTCCPGGVFKIKRDGRRMIMKKLLFALAALGMLSAAAPASAQYVEYGYYGPSYYRGWWGGPYRHHFYSHAYRSWWGGPYRDSYE